jgi:uncharacterized protein YjbI with pentapeptide repeats
MQLTTSRSTRSTNRSRSCPPPRYVWCNLGVAGWVWLAIGVSVVGIGLIAVGVWVGSGASNSRRHQLVASLASDAGVALVTGAVVGVVIFLATDSLERNLLDAQETFEEDRFERDVRRDNLRFVREVATQVGPKTKPFAGLDLREGHLAGLDLSEADLAGADLAGADLAGADLTGADLAGADLTGADLAGADLTDVHLVEADLTGANLKAADLPGADLTDADLLGADLTDADLTDADLSDADLSDAKLNDAILEDFTSDDDTVWPDGFEPRSGSRRHR